MENGSWLYVGVGRGFGGVFYYRYLQVVRIIQASTVQFFVGSRAGIWISVIFTSALIVLRKTAQETFNFQYSS